MKKLFSLILVVAMLFSFAACSSGADEGNSGSIKFGSEIYSVNVGEYLMISDDVVVDPAGTKVVYEVSDTEIATITKKGEIGGVKVGTVTVTAKTEDGKVSATCTVVVNGFGTIVDRDPVTGEGGITMKRYNLNEAPPDPEAIIVVISKNIDKSVDKTAITTLNYGTINEKGYYLISGDGFYVARNNGNGNYLIENAPAGDYVGLIICSKDYTQDKTYDNSTIAATLKASKLGEVLSETEINAIAGRSEIQSREFFVSEFTVVPQETTVFGHAFKIDNN